MVVLPKAGLEAAPRFALGTGERQVGNYSKE